MNHNDGTVLGVVHTTVVVDPDSNGGLTLNLTAGLVMNSYILDSTMRVS